MRRAFTLLPVLLLLAGVADSALAQDDGWKNKWYWGAHAGAYTFKTPLSPGPGAAVGFGGHWLITRDRVALFTGVEQNYFFTVRSIVNNPASATGTTRVKWTGGRRIQAGLYAIPLDRQLQVFGGVGFMINYITDAEPEDPNLAVAEAQAAVNAIDDASTKAFAVFSAGAQWRNGRWAFFGQYQYTPPAGDFLITQETHTVMGGIRFALTSAREDVSTASR